MIIVIEGGDQAGKKTQSNLLTNKLKSKKIKTKTFSFPDYSTPVGKEIKHYLSGKRKFTPQVIHCLLAANRWEKLEEIKKAQSKFSVLIMNRYYQSNIVYGLANGMNEKWLENLDAGIPRADLVIVLDISQAESFKRKSKKRDKFEKDREFLKKISILYKKMAKKKRWQIVNALRPKEEIHNDIMKIFAKKLQI
ncbi:MAG: dTMP kinase [Nitrosopumilaceae archaeon]|nr:dTMP kinase [Nitrosopumilaceae archaeon]NIU00798.1 dTMP kinase [Nitrosopumilaceae archaeon]NIU87251.1 dTMP kinase [Nitrosopumilaceae archaeon]NIV65779.1 dTMP kinase [Nitrosopumilaceae archaeon]NIX61400.1 dTMP kinase [Nitrosopumilaceae archaeon]